MTAASHACKAIGVGPPSGQAESMSYTFSDKPEAANGDADDAAPPPAV
jgi:hypothetical protein